MRNTIIITGHGSYASGISSFVRMVAGNIEGVEYVDFTEDISSNTLSGIYHEKIEKSKGQKVLFICDIVGGTPFNEAVKCAASSELVEVVAGGNPVSILEACFTKDDLNMEQIIENIIQNTKKNVMKFIPLEKGNSVIKTDFSVNGI